MVVENGNIVVMNQAMTKRCSTKEQHLEWGGYFDKCLNTNVVGGTARRLEPGEG